MKRENKGQEYHQQQQLQTKCMEVKDTLKCHLSNSTATKFPVTHSIARNSTSLSSEYLHHCCWWNMDLIHIFWNYILILLTKTCGKYRERVAMCHAKEFKCTNEFEHVCVCVFLYGLSKFTFCSNFWIVKVGEHIQSIHPSTTSAKNFTYEYSMEILLILLHKSAIRENLVGSYEKSVISSSFSWSSFLGEFL